MAYFIGVIVYLVALAMLLRFFHALEIDEQKLFWLWNTTRRRETTDRAADPTPRITRARRVSQPKHTAGPKLGRRRIVQTGRA